MAKNIRTVRLDEQQMKRIGEFLIRNPFLDFSSLARMAIDQFIMNPTIQIQPIADKKKVRQKERGT